MPELHQDRPFFRSSLELTHQIGEVEDERYQSLVENLSIGIVVHEDSTRILFANKAACQMLGLSKNEVEQTYATDPQWKFIEEDGSRMELARFPVNQVLKTKSRMPTIVVGISKGEEGLITWVQCDAYPIMDSMGRIQQVIVNFTDISQRIYLEKELRKAKEAKSRFIDIAAHELKNPIAALSAQVELTIRQLKKGQTIELKSLEKIQRQTNRVTNLVVSLLDVSRLEKNVIRLNMENHDLVCLIKDCIQDFKLSHSESEIHFINNEKDCLKVNLDRDRIFQVITNLLDNANKYSEQKPIIVELSATSKEITIAIIDQGEEIPASIREEIFRPFIRGEDKLKSSTPGLGLGLYICQSILEMHGGKIKLKRSDKGENVFMIELPRGTP